MKYKVEISSYKPSARNIRHFVFFFLFFFSPPHFHTRDHYNSIHTADHRELSQSHTSQEDFSPEEAWRDYRLAGASRAHKLILCVIRTSASHPGSL